MNTARILLILLCLVPLAVLGVAPSPRDRPDATPTPRTVLDGVQSFFRKTARADGSFRPGLDVEYEGISDSAYSDLAPVTYAVILHKTFGWELPSPKQTRAFLHSRQRRDGAFFNIQGT